MAERSNVIGNLTAASCDHLTNMQSDTRKSNFHDARRVNCQF